MSIFYVNGQYVDEDDAVLSVRDLAVLRGYGAFDFLRTYGGQPFRLAHNIARLRRSCEVIELDFPWSNDEVEAIVLETLARNVDTAADFNIRLVVTGGISSNNITPDGEPSLAVLVQPLSPIPQAWYDEGVKIITLEMNRLYPASKSINYIPAIIAQKRAREQGAVEAIYKDSEGNVLEGTTVNLFAFYGNTLVTTPAEGAILPGITRHTVLEIAQEHFDIQERILSYEEVLRADEVFITAANKQVVPAVQIDDTIINDGKPGEGTHQIMALFQDLTERRAAGVEI